MSVKNLILRPIDAASAAGVIKTHHYSGAVKPNSSLHIGVYLHGKLEGAMSFGSPIDRRKVLPFVRDTLWNQMLELNRMAFSEALPRNSESRALAIAFRMIRKHRPDIKWILSFSDATQCGDGVIYRASGFLLCGVKRNTTMLKMPDGSVVADKTLNNHGNIGTAVAKAAGAVPLSGYQMRYIKFLDESWRDRLTLPVIPFDKIPTEARMYRGIRPNASASSEGVAVHAANDGAAPIRTLQSEASDG